MEQGVDARWLDEQTRDFGQLPAGLATAVLSVPIGTLAQRSRTALDLRRKLLEGVALEASDLSLLPVAARAEVLSAVQRYQLARRCVGNAEVTNALIESMMTACERSTLDCPVSVESLFRDLREREHVRSRPHPMSNATLEALYEQAQQRASEAAAAIARGVLQQQWEQRARAWAAIESVLGDLGSQLGLGWDLTHAALRSVGWMNAEHLRKLLQQLPQLRAVIQALGRLQHPADGVPSSFDRVVELIARPVPEFDAIDDPTIPIEVRGIEQTSDPARMLPTEAALLRHPKLRLLWHARRADAQLLAWLATSSAASTASGELQQAELERPAAKQQRGPILVCVDTSGSMQGAPETVAKAVVLEVARVALAQRRSCHLYGFSGPGDVAEHTVSLAPAGVAALLRFLGQSFYGGTDPTEAVARAAARLEQEQWRAADLLIVSDGEFPVPTSASQTIATGRSDRGLVVTGILVAQQESAGMSALCDQIARFSEWQQLLGHQFVGDDS